VVLAQTQQISEGAKFVMQFHQEMRTRAKPDRQHLLRAMFFLYSSAIYVALRLTELNLRVKCVFFLIHRIFFFCLQELEAQRSSKALAFKR
jgi:hypothetical protein